MCTRCNGDRFLSKATGKAWTDGYTGDEESLPLRSALVISCCLDEPEPCPECNPDGKLKLREEMPSCTS